MEYQTPSFDEIQAATLLVHECCDLGSDPEAWQMHLLDGLRTLLNAPVALLHKAAGLGRLGEDGKPQIITAIHLGFDQRQEDAFREFTQTYDVRDCPLEQAIARRMRVGSVFTARESEILDSQTWWNSHLVKNYLPRPRRAAVHARGAVYQLGWHRIFPDPAAAHRRTRILGKRTRPIAATSDRCSRTRITSAAGVGRSASLGTSQNSLKKRKPLPHGR